MIKYHENGHVYITRLLTRPRLPPRVGVFVTATVWDHLPIASKAKIHDP